MLDSPAGYYFWEKISLGYHMRAGALSLMLYDYFLTLDDEIELFWKRRWTLATYLFLWTRYCGVVFLIVTFLLITNISDHNSAFVFYPVPQPSHVSIGRPYFRCTAWYTVEALLGTLNTCVVEFILVLRLYALYNCSDRFAQAAKYAFGLQLLVMSGYGAYALSATLESLDTDISDGFIYCEILDPRAVRAWIFWIPLGFFDAFVLTMSIQKALYYYHTSKTTVRLTNLLSTLMWDSIAYAVLIELVYIMNIILDSIDGRNLDVLTGLGFTLPIIMGGRMMISVRRTFCDDQYRQAPSSPSDISLHVIDIDEEPPSPPSIFKYI